MGEIWEMKKANKEKMIYKDQLKELYFPLARKLYSAMSEVAVKILKEEELLKNVRQEGEIIRFSITKIGCTAWEEACLKIAFDLIGRKQSTMGKLLYLVEYIQKQIKQLEKKNE